MAIIIIIIILVYGRHKQKSNLKIDDSDNNGQRKCVSRVYRKINRFTERKNRKSPIIELSRGVVESRHRRSNVPSLFGGSSPFVPDRSIFGAQFERGVSSRQIEMLINRETRRGCGIRDRRK